MIIIATKELCKANNLWLHLEGHALSALTLLPTKDPSTMVQRGDSMTLTFGSWVGIPSVPFVTLYKNDTPSAQIAGNSRPCCDHSLIAVMVKG